MAHLFILLRHFIFSLPLLLIELLHHQSHLLLLLDQLLSSCFLRPFDLLPLVDLLVDLLLRRQLTLDCVIKLLSHVFLAILIQSGGLGRNRLPLNLIQVPLSLLFIGVLGDHVAQIRLSDI